jgi:hypothetical protein
MLHAYLYYELDQSIWTDHDYDYQARRLYYLQQHYGTQHGFEDDLFADWRGDTGMHLLTRVSDGMKLKAQYLLSQYTEPVSIRKDGILDVKYPFLFREDLEEVTYGTTQDR